MIRIILLSCFLSLSFYANSQTNVDVLAKIRYEAFQNSQAMDILSELTDVYGARLTGTYEYKKAADWTLEKLKEYGFEDVHFESYCDNCRGWAVKGFNVEMVSPNYMGIMAYPLTHTKSTTGTVQGEVVHIESFRDMDKIRKEYKGSLKGKVVLLGRLPKANMLFDPLSSRYDDEGLEEKEKMLSPGREGTPLPDLLKGWETSDKSDQDFLKFCEKEGVYALMTTRSLAPGILHPGATYYYRNDDYKPLPYFAIMPEHFSRMVRMIDHGESPTLRVNLTTEFYMEPENNVNIIAEIPGSDPNLKSEVILAGGHFDSWHSATGATDNGASCVAIIEAFRILNDAGLKPKRTLRLGLWGGEEQAFLGSVSYAKSHYGPLDKKPNKESEKVSAYLNLDNGAGAIRGVYLQGNEGARTHFEEIFGDIEDLTDGAVTIDNTFSTDHETFDHYNIPAFQFIQDRLNYNTVTHHTNLDFIEYVPEEDLMKNAAILAWTLYRIGNSDTMVPRKR